MKLNQENQGSLALFLWFAFLNSQLLMAVLVFLYWRLEHPGVPLSTMRFWDPTLNDNLSTILFMMGGVAAAVGLRMGMRYFAQAKEATGPVPPALLIIAYVLLDFVGVVGIVLGLTKGNALLAVPFLGVAVLLIAVLFPSSHRFPGRRG